jgi:hypothetical protein
MDLTVRVTGSHLLWGLPLLDLAPCGGYLAAGFKPAPVVSYTTFSPLHSTRKWTAVCLCGPIRQVASTNFVQVARPGNYPAHCPMECGLSSMAQGHCGHPASLGNSSYHNFLHDYGGNTSNAVKFTQYNPATFGTTLTMASPITFAGSSN